MSAPIDDAFSNFHRDEAGESLRGAATSAATAFAVTITADMGDLHMTKGYKHALISPQAEYWSIAIDKKLLGLIALDTWSDVRACDLPAGSIIMSCHYIFTVKRKADGSIDKFKARLVGDGNTQRYSIDYDRIFATVVRSLTIQLVLIIAAARDHNLSFLDIRQA
jgi:hypothetical protein